MTPPNAPPLSPPANRPATTASPPGSPLGPDPAAAVSRPLPTRHDFGGAEIIARVGDEVVQAVEVVPAVTEYLSRLTKDSGQVPDAELDRAFRMLMRQRISELTNIKLVLNDARKTIPPENLEKIEKEQNAEFEKENLAKLIEAAGVSTRDELVAKLKQSGNTLELQRRAWFESRIAGEWLRRQVKISDEITHEQLVNYYRQHSAEFELTPQVRWEQLSALLSNHDNSPQECHRLVAEWGNRVLGGAAWAEVAQAHSEDSAGKSGGVHDWTPQGSLASDVLDAALFSLPIGKPSRIIEDERGFHIVRVLERKEETRRPFAESQGEIRRKIKDERFKQGRSDYLARLRQQTLVSTIFDGLPSEDAADASSARRPAAGGATTR